MTLLTRLKRACLSRQEFKQFIQTREHPEEGTAYFNEDLLPTPPGQLLFEIILDSMSN